jgi:hypothetical protein
VSLRARLRRLEQRCPAAGAGEALSLEEEVAEGQRLDRWLKGQGLSARAARATGLAGPPGLRPQSLEVAAEAEWGLLRWHRQRAREALAQEQARAEEFERADAGFRGPDAYHRQAVARLRAELADLERQIAEDEALGPPPWGLPWD